MHWKKTSMKYLIVLLFALTTFACSHGDKQREDVPGTHGRGAANPAPGIDTTGIGDTATAR